MFKTIQVDRSEMPINFEWVYYLIIAEKNCDSKFNLKSSDSAIRSSYRLIIKRKIQRIFACLSSKHVKRV